jgi:hypothetical protein
LIALFEGNPNVGQTCADHVREYRNQFVRQTNISARNNVNF